MVKILVVDDEKDIREELALFLSQLGHDVKAAADGHEALRLCWEAPADIIFSDADLPGPCGIQLIGQYRRLCPNARLFIITGKIQLGPNYWKLLGADDCFEKPFSLNQIAAVVAKLAA